MNRRISNPSPRASDSPISPRYPRSGSSGGSAPKQAFLRSNPSSPLPNSPKASPPVRQNPSSQHHQKPPKLLKNNNEPRERSSIRPEYFASSLGSKASPKTFGGSPDSDDGALHARNTSTESESQGGPETFEENEQKSYYEDKIPDIISNSMSELHAKIGEFAMGLENIQKNRVLLNSQWEETHEDVEKYSNKLKEMKDMLKSRTNHLNSILKHK